MAHFYTAASGQAGEAAAKAITRRDRLARKAA